MKARALTERVRALGAVDWDNRLFDSLIPLPDGTSYNSYLVRGDSRTVLIDTVEPSMAEVLLRQLDDEPVVDLIVSLHAEQDHSGSLPAVTARYPDAPVLCSKKARGMLVDLLGLPVERLRVVADGEEIDLGGATLRFLGTPWAHWPETMSAFLVEEGVLFSCDLFGSHLATSDLVAADDGTTREAAKRYYAEIMMPFARQLEKTLTKLADLDIEVIAPSHGPVHVPPEPILAAYEEWIHGPPKNRVTVAFVSMHHSTQALVDRLVSALMDRGVAVDRFNLTVTDIGRLAMALVDAGTLVLATPNVLGGAHPAVVYAAYLANSLKPKARYLGVLGSYGWKGNIPAAVDALLPDLDAERLEPVLAQGRPTDTDLAAVDALAETIAEKHRESGFE